MENKNWPEKARSKMIEKSEIYPISKDVYQYGFYDGYQYKNEQCQKRDELIKAQDELIELLSDSLLKESQGEVSMSEGLWIAKDWNELKNKIEQLKKELLT